MTAATMSVPEAAALLGISEPHAYNLARRGELPGARRLGRTVRVSRRQLLEFIDGPAVAMAVDPEASTAPRPSYASPADVSGSTVIGAPSESVLGSSRVARRSNPTKARQSRGARRRGAA